MDNSKTTIAGSRNKTKQGESSNKISYVAKWCEDLIIPTPHCIPKSSPCVDPAIRYINMEVIINLKISTDEELDRLSELSVCMMNMQSNYSGLIRMRPVFIIFTFLALKRLTKTNVENNLHVYTSSYKGSIRLMYTGNELELYRPITWSNEYSWLCQEIETEWLVKGTIRSTKSNHEFLTCNNPSTMLSLFHELEVDCTWCDAENTLILKL